MGTWGEIFPSGEDVRGGDIWPRRSLHSCDASVWRVLFTRLAKRRKSDCAGEGAEYVRGWEMEWAMAIPLVRVGVCVRVFAFAVEEPHRGNIPVPLVFTYQALQRGNQWVRWDQQGLVQLDFDKHHVLTSKRGRLYRS